MITSVRPAHAEDKGGHYHQRSLASSVLSRVPMVIAIQLLLLIASGSAGAQDYLTAIGQPTFSSPEPVEYGYVEKANGHLHLEFPLGDPLPQRGGHEPFQFRLVYDTNYWRINSGYQSSWWSPWTGNMLQEGWNLLPGYNWGASPDIEEANGCTHNWSWIDPNGTFHWFPLNVSSGKSYASCSDPLTGSALATDSSGYRLYVDDTQLNVMKAQVYSPDGRLVSDHQYGPVNYPPYWNITDANGNYENQGITNSGLFIDTLGRVAMNQPGGNGQTDCTGSSGHWCYDVPNSTGTASRYITEDAMIIVSTHFGKSGVTECSGTPPNACYMRVITKVTLPDGSNFSFKFDCDPSIAGQSALCGSPVGQTGYYGEIVSMTLPTGGTIQYNYSSFTDSYNNVARWLSRRTAAGDSWTYTPQVISTCSPTQVGCQQKITVAEPNGRTTLTTFTLNNGAWPVQTQIYRDSTLLSTMNTTWDFSIACVLRDCHGNSYIRKTAETTTVPSASGVSLTRKRAFAYDSPQKGNVTAVKEWGYYPGVSPSFPSVSDRATYTAFYAPADSPCLGYGGRNIINRPSSITVCSNSGSDSACAGGGSRVSQTLTTYDSYGTNGLTLITGVVNHDDTHYGSCLAVRGNSTQIRKWLSGNTYLTSQLSYDTTGQVTSSTDPRGNSTTFDYSDNFYTDNGTSSLARYTPPQPTHAYVTTTTMPPVAAGTFHETLGYYFGSGKMAFSTDLNNQTSYFHFVNPLTLQSDPLDRLTESIFPIGWNLINYISATQVDMYVAVADTSPSTGCSSCRHTQFTYDTWGRKVSQQLVNSPAGVTGVDTSYDSTGRVQSTSHPWGPLDPTKVYETLAYDGFDRTIQVMHPDNQVQQTLYGPAVGNMAQQGSPSVYGYGYPALITDEAGKQRQTWTDGLGRIIEVDEPSATTTPGTGSGTVAGSEQSVPVPATKSTGTFTLFGGPPASGCGGSGPVLLYVNGAVIAGAGYGPGSTLTAVASTLTTTINNNSSSPVTATVNGATIRVTSKAAGASTNYSMRGSPTGISPPCATIAVQWAGMSGGTDAHTAYDTGSAWITVNGVQASVSYRQGDTPVTVAGALATAINGNLSSPVTAVLSGTVVNVIAKTSGSSSNYSLTTGSSTSQPSLFSQPSFTVTASGASLTGGAGGVGGSPLATLYKYDAADRLVQVIQGQQTRNYVYDGAGHLTSASAPELSNSSTPPQQCPVTLTYDGNGNMLTQTAPAPNQHSCTQTVVTSRCYDALDRVVSKAYTAQSCPMSAPAATYSYDEGGASAYALGRLTSMSDASGSETYSYDQVGRVVQVQKVVDGRSYSTTYTLNAAGQLTQIRYPSGRLVTHNYDAIGRLAGVSSGTTSYVTVPSSNGYNAGGQLLTYTYGNGVVATLSYSPDRSQLVSLSYTKNNQTLFGLNYGYKNAQANCGSDKGNGNAGIIQCVQDLGGVQEAGRSAVYSYDQLNRLSAAVTTGSMTYPRWGLAWTYDRYGNRLSQSVTAGSAPGPATPSDPVTNRILGYDYDAKGNMLGDGINSLTYDPENRLTGAAGSNGSGAYTYDDNTHRVKKVANGTSTVYAFAGSQVVAEYENGAPVDSPSREYIYANGRPVAKIAAGVITYYHPDHLSVRVLTDATGTKIGEQGHYPFGELWYATGTTTKYVFTTYERDSESGNDYALARSYSSRLGRFCSVDPVEGVALNPQSWNRYTYVLNNPIKFSDPSGKSCQWDDGTSDDSPEDGGATQSECEEQGGTWAPEMSELGLPDPTGLDDLLNLPVQMPDPPPGYRDCIEAALREVIAHGEGTDREPNGGYGTLVHGTVISAPQQFANLVNTRNAHVDPAATNGHPQIRVQVNANLTSSAFGRYQIMANTARNYGFTDFGPAGQDTAANSLMAHRNMITPAMNGDVEQGILNGNREWASLPGSPYGQPTMTMQAARAVFENALHTLPDCQPH